MGIELHPSLPSFLPALLLLPHSLPFPSLPQKESPQIRRLHLRRHRHLNDAVEDPDTAPQASTTPSSSSSSPSTTTSSAATSTTPSPLPKTPLLFVNQIHSFFSGPEFF
ncbi:hypothetical protein TIFTF001_053150 [Ficus carica]|uniref:Uncharacterized protein n=1 Tax=Ficus carica TaxID=3494 RepID=A0AA88EGJ4_FICCA|nr:hypothetical protein TIFTF001_053150 [Ficus carica]